MRPAFRFIWQPVFLLVVSSLMANSCKTTQNPGLSQVKSLTDEELTKCEFSGRRWMYTIAPEPDFQMDVKAGEEIFRSFTDTVLVSDSVLVDPSKGLAQDQVERCLEHRKKTLGKYEVHSVSTGKTVTPEEVESRIDQLSQKIKAYRAQEGDNSGEVQVLIQVASHGDNQGFQYPANVMVLGGESTLDYDRFSKLLFNKLVTKCIDEKCNIAAKDRLADEIIVLMDNCFSGGYIDSMDTLLAGSAGYSTKITTKDTQHTRLINIASAHGGQVAAGAVKTTKTGTLVTAFQEILTNWSGAGTNGLITWNDVETFLPISARGHFTETAVENAALVGALALCAPGYAPEMKKAIDQNPAYFTRLFTNPLQTLEQEMPPIELYFKLKMVFVIHIPVFSSNLSDEMLAAYAFAATSPSVAGSSKTGAEFKKAMVQRRQEMEAIIPSQYKLLSIIYQSMSGKPDMTSPPQDYKAAAGPEVTDFESLKDKLSIRGDIGLEGALDRVQSMCQKLQQESTGKDSSNQ